MPAFFLPCFYLFKIHGFICKQSIPPSHSIQQFRFNVFCIHISPFIHIAYKNYSICKS